MAIFTNFIAGRYDGTWDAVALGMTRNGFEIMVTPNYEQINDSDLGGESLLDLIYLGANCTVRCECKEYATGAVSPFWPFTGAATAVGGSSNGLGRAFSSTYPVGRLASDLAKALVLTVAANTPAAGGGTGKPTSLTGTYSILAPGQNGQLMMNPKLRHIPLFMQLLPYPFASNDYRHFATT